ncbi:uncharacterized protein LOC124140652 isoform X2 [Haliotis rufescens]|uniref:uncharacterized protein LOC124140652 isoform X2 n=1 Tax=Haliotis rufescens TaxID=6454 RepID=UPI00201EF858|nr:uncharacterized protein LOC124140652 isoform X2 [Haliotis rufescens]
MQHLPIYESVVEVIQAFLLSFPLAEFDVSSCSIAVDIKAKKKVHHDYDRQVFYVRVSSSQDLDLQNLFKEKALTRFTEVLLYMQCGEEEGHLSVQRPCQDHMRGSVQEVFWLEQTDLGDITLKCQHSTEAPNTDFNETPPPFVIHFRIVQSESHIVSEGQLIHKFLHKLKFLHGKLETTFSMKVCGAVCQTDFSVRNFVQVKGVSFVDDLRFFFGKGCLKTMCCGTVKGFKGRSMAVGVNSGCPLSPSPLSVSTMACLYPVTERYPQHTGSGGITGHVLINFYGPQLSPLLMSRGHLTMLDIRKLTDWNTMSLWLTDTEQKMQSDMTAAATLTNQRYLPPWASGATSFLLCLAVIVSDPRAEDHTSRNREIIKHLQGDPNFLPQLYPAIGESLHSSLQHIFANRATEYEKMHGKTYVQSIQMIASAICDVFNHSTNVSFRNDMSHLLQVDTRQTLENALKARLLEIAHVSDAEILETETGDADTDIDEWGEATHPRRAHTAGSTGDNEDTAHSIATSQVLWNVFSRQQVNLATNMLQEPDDFDEDIHSRSYRLHGNSLRTETQQDLSSSERARQGSPGVISVDSDLEMSLNIQDIDNFEDDTGSRSLPSRTLDTNQVLVQEPHFYPVNQREDDDLVVPPISPATFSDAGRPHHQQQSVDDWLNEVMLDVADWL